MKRLGFLTVFFAVNILLVGAVSGGVVDPCPGDCNQDTLMRIDESVLGVNIALGYADVADCRNLDMDDDDDITVNELVMATGSLISNCGRIEPTEPYCGNGIVEASLGEECDDGGICVGGENELEECTETADCPDGACRPVGADGCAINCTGERLRKANLNTALQFRAQADVQQATFPINIPLRGFQGFTTGKALDVEVKGPQGEVITRPGDYPVAIKPNDVFFEPVQVTGLVCACVRQVEVPTFGRPGFPNSAVGVIACGAAGIDNISYKLVQDHVTIPGHPSNGNTPPVAGEQLSDDAECDDAFEFPGSGLISEACLEGTDELCEDPNERGQHPNICNSPRNITFFGGHFDRGNALINNATAIGLLNDAGQCRTDLSPGDPECATAFLDYGPDCQPCTGDDADLGDPENLPTTTGMGSAAVYDVVLQKGRTIDVTDPLFIPCATTAECEPGQRCVRQCRDSGRACPRGNECGTTGDVCQAGGCSWTGCGTDQFINRCITSKQGRAFNCDALAADQTPDDGDGDGMSGAALAVTFPALDSRRIGDNVTSSVLDLE